MEQKPKVVFILGGPGSGKGTQSAIICKNYNFVHLSAGDLLREERKSGSENGQLIEKYIKDGKIVPSHITVRLLHNAMQKHGINAGRFLIDGFPRNIENYENWQKEMGTLVEVPFVINLDCKREVMISRLLERSKISGRVDDNIETIQKRLVTAEQETSKVLEVFKNQGRLRTYEADRSIEDISKDISKEFEKVLGQHAATL